MGKIDVKTEAAKLQETLDVITRNGFWFGVYFPEGDNLTFHPYRLEVLGAHPDLAPDGSVKAWNYSVLMIDRGFVDFGASTHGNHLHFVTKIEWVRAPDARIYAGRLFDDDGNKIIINELDWSEDQELADEWKAYVKRLDTMPKRVEECRKCVIREFMEMVEAHFR
jgi:hypothetical protein